MLLVLDGHLPHTTNIALLEATRQSNVHILPIPSYKFHRLQPLAVAFMFPSSKLYTGKDITIRLVDMIFSESYLKASTPQNAINGFKNIFPDKTSTASKTTDRYVISGSPDAVDIVASEVLVSPRNPENIRRSSTLISW